MHELRVEIVLDWNPSANLVSPEASSRSQSQSVIEGPCRIVTCTLLDLYTSANLLKIGNALTSVRSVFIL